MDRVRVGFIGCGGIAQFHFRHMPNIEEADVVAVCDKVEERAKAAGERFDATPYTVYADMFEKEKLDAVYVCVEPGAHDGMEFMAMEHGCHIFVQKPMSLDLDYSLRVRDMLAEKKLISAVGFQCRYAETLPRVKAWLAGQQIGMVSAHRLGGLPMVWWWRERAQSGGQIIEQTVHNYDVLRYLLGDVTAVCGMGRQGTMGEIENYDVDDASTVVMQFESGVVAQITTGCFSPPGLGKSNFEFFTKQGILEYGLGGNYKIRQANMTIEGKSGNDYGQECDDAFIDAVLSNDQSLVLSPYADACKSLELVLAATQSVENGGELIRIG
ncbi:MAG: Gfo/Idh/MocA family oxidoreductase [Lentisphaeria bacterium]|nr:Gfo/Idh/MocA family oxidoreductase [Lentisphaeria bacterium]